MGVAMEALGKQRGTAVESGQGVTLPRSIGVMIAAFGALLCWGALIGIARAFS
jgi:hypothetical protein